MDCSRGRWDVDGKQRDVSRIGDCVVLRQQGLHHQFQGLAFARAGGFLDDEPMLRDRFFDHLGFQHVPPGQQDR